LKLYYHACGSWGQVTAVREADQQGLQFVRDLYACGWDSAGAVALISSPKPIQWEVFEEYEGIPALERCFAAISRAAAANPCYFAQVFEVRSGKPVLMGAFGHSTDGEIEKIAVDEEEVQNER